MTLFSVLSIAAPAAPDTPKGSIALLLPLKSALYSKAAEAVKQGFMAAYSQSPASGNQKLPIRIYPTGDQVESILEAYQLALQEGNLIIIGPLTRSGVTAIAESKLVNIPTLALNIPENDIALPANLYSFGLSVEGEARQIARMAYNDGKKSAATVTANNPLAKRSQQAFIDEWQKLGQKVIAQFSFTGEVSSVSTLRDALAKKSPDMVFLAADVEKARMVRPYLGVTNATYATSQISGGKNEPARDVDLNGVVFLDMPWLLQPDHPAVMIYPRQDKFISADLERLYALGIDAYRLSEMLHSSPNRSLTLDGVTGRITFSGDNQILRELTPATFRQGIATLPDAIAP